MTEISLSVDGYVYGGWKRVRVTRSIEHLAGDFELEVTERWQDAAAPRPIRPGHACSIRIGDQVVITGYVDDARPRYDAASAGVTVAGRDRTGDLVDCSVLHAQWAAADLERIARDVCQPFGIPVATAAAVGAPFAMETATVQQGETGSELLSRLARHRALLLVADGRGGLQITKAGRGRAVTELVEGQNILSATGAFSWRDRFSSYRVLGSRTGFDESTPKQNAHPIGEVTDPAVTRHRPRVLLAEEQVDSAIAKQRAAWEQRTRAGRSGRATVVVQGWLQGDGAVWQPNTLATIRSPRLGLPKATWLIVSVSHLLGEDGSLTELELCPPSAFDLLAEPEEQEALYG